MTSEPRSSASYAYYSFPPTPNRSSPPASADPSPKTPSPKTPTPGARSSSATPTPHTARTSKSMAPSPAAGKAVPNAPKTPTKVGKNPASSATSKLGQSQSATDSPKDVAKSATSTPKSTAKGATDKAKSSAPTKSSTSSPKLPPRPKDADGATSKAKDTASGAKDAASNAKDSAPKAPEPVEETKGKAEDTADDAVEDSGNKIGMTDNDPADEADTEENDTPAGKVSQAGNETGGEDESNVSTTDDVEDATGKAQDTADDVQNEAENTAAGAQDTAEDAADDTEVPDTEDTEEIGENAEDESGKAVNGIAGKATGVKDAAEDTAEEAGDEAPDAADGADATDGVEDAAGQAAEGTKGTAENTAEELPVDLSVLKGLEVGEGGQILDKDGEPIGQLEEGDPEDMAGKTIGDDGEILDEDGDVIGRASVLPDKAKELADQGKEGIPDVGVLDGLEVGEDGNIMGADGTPIGKLIEGNAEDLKGLKLNEKGEIVDEDGDVVGRAEVIPEEAGDKLDEAGDKLDEAGDKLDEAKDELPEVGALEGLEVGEGGEILDQDGNQLGKLVEGDNEDLMGQTLNEKGEIVDEEGNVLGRAEVVPGEVAEKLNEEAGGLTPDLSILTGKKVNKKGNILDGEGEPIGKLTEDSDLKKCVGKAPNENGEIVDDKGEVVGKVEVVPGEAAHEAMKELHPELVEEQKKAAEEAAAEAEVPDFSILEGLKVNKKGEVLNEDGEPIAKLSEGELKNCTGKKINDQGEVIDKDGKVIGKVELIPQEGAEDVEGEETAEGVEAVEAPKEQGPDLSILEGLKVNKKGDVINEDGDVVARLSEGELSDVAGKKINEKGEILDSEGNVIGRVELVPQEGEEEEDAGPQLPPLSILEGLKCNKSGKIVNANGKPVGELIEGDAKKLARSGTECDAEGQFWDGKGHVIGKAQTLAQEDDEEDSPFAGLEGLIVVKDGFVEDENGNKVGIIVDGDAKKLVGRSVDEDGDVIDKRGNVVGHAERYEEPEEAEAEKADLSILKGLAVNKQGNVIGPDGVPIARLIEGNAKELAGRKCDEEGQIWNDSGNVVGRCELIPDNEREAKPEGPFAGLEGLVVVKGGMVEDEDGNTVGEVVDGDPKKLVGRAVDEDGDIIDKHGTVKGHAEPYEAPEEEAVDLSPLEGKIVNKSGNVVDEHGTIYGRVAEGDPKSLAGKYVDGQGQIWGGNGKVVGRAELIPGGTPQKPEGPFAGFENLVVAKDGMVTDSNGQIVGKLVEGSDPVKLLGRKVDEDGDILDNSGNSIGQAERYTPEEAKRDINPMSGRKVNKEGEVRDEDGNVIGKLTDGHLPSLIGKVIDDNGYVVDNDGNKVGECTLIENIPEPDEPDEVGPTEEELEEARQKQEDADVAKKMNYILQQTLEKMQPLCKNITERIERADRTPKEELDEEALVQDVKPMLEEGGRILQECNGAIRGLDPDGHVAANAKARAASGEATKEEYAVAESLKELTSTVVTTIENAKKKVADMPHAKKALNPLWGLLTEPLFQILAAVGLLLAGVLGLVGKLLGGLGLGGLVNGLLGGLGIDKLLGGLGLGSITSALGGGKKK